MRLVVRVDTTAARRALGRFRDQVPYATSLGINETLKIAQVAQRTHQRGAFHVRNDRFVDQAVKIKPFATKARLAGVIQIDPPGGAARASILTQHEEGGIKTPLSGRSLFIPEPRGATPIRKIRSASGGVLVSSGFRPGELDLRPWGHSGRVEVGKDGIFLIRLPNGDGIVLQRTGTGRRGPAQNIHTHHTRWFGRRSTVRVLYSLTREGRIAPRLQFHEVVLRAIEQNWGAQIRVALIRAIETAR